MIQIPNPGEYGDGSFHKVISTEVWRKVYWGADLIPCRSHPQPVQVYRVPPQVDLLGKWSGDFDHRGAFLDSAPKIPTRYELKQIPSGPCLICGAEDINPRWRLTELELVHRPSCERSLQITLDTWGHKECLEKIHPKSAVKPLLDDVTSKLLGALESIF